MIKTVLGSIPENEVGITLPHEHICQFNDYLYSMGGKFYLDKEKLLNSSVKHLSKLKSDYSLNTFIDCTPVNTGRDIELLKEISKKSGVNIICSTGFYYTEEPLLNNRNVDYLADIIVSDAKKNNVGIIKCTVENEVLNALEQKLLMSCAKAQLILNLPLVVHTNAQNKNGLEALKLLINMGVQPEAITIALLSDTDDIEYIKQIASFGCFIGLNTAYNVTKDNYFSKTVNKINALCDSGYSDKILLSHNTAFFNGYELKAKINDKPRFSYCFDYILPLLPKDTAQKIIKENPLKMLKCGE